MTRQELKDWVLSTLFNILGHLAAERTKEEWFQKNGFSDFYAEIVNATSFLAEDVLFSERIHCLLHDIVSPVLCKKEGCLNKVGFKTFSKGYCDHCSPKHAVSSEQTQEKIKATIQRKYGYDYVFNVPSVQVKIKASNHERHGAENFAQSPAFWGRAVESNRDRFGVDSFSQIDYTEEQMSRLNDKEFLLDEHVNKRKTITLIAHEIGVSESTVSNYFRRHGIETLLFPFSQPEREIAEFIGDIRKVTNDRTVLAPKELDLYLPDYKLAIEYDGLFYHSSGSRDQDSKYKAMHLFKTKACLEKGIQLLHIFESEWVDPVKKDVWKSIINNKLGKSTGIFARKCQVKEVSPSVAREFLMANHLQGATGSQVKVGLFYEDELVSLMTFGKSRYNKGYQFELVRYCNKKGLNVIGGPSRCFSYFVRTYSPSSIISYSDRRYSVGKMYEKLGMSLLGVSDPNYFYFKEGKLVLEPRVKYQKHKLHSLLEGFDPNLTEIENMYAHGFRRIWDCGNMVYEWRRP